MTIATTDRIELAFNQFHEKNPEIYTDLVQLAREWVNRGGKRLGIATLFERLRWEYSYVGLDLGEFKLNNNYRALYARKIMADNEDLRGLFMLRERRTPVIAVPA